jgi:hypothetical protein
VNWKSAAFQLKLNPLWGIKIGDALVMPIAGGDGSILWEALMMRYQLWWLWIFSEGYSLGFQEWVNEPTYLRD